MELEQNISLRHKLHKHPELSSYEANTVVIIKSFLEQYPPDQLIEGLGYQSFGAVYRMGAGAPTIMIRAELDALPIDEPNDLEYRSNYSGVSHKCGHDGHMSIISALAPWLHSKPFDRGTIILLYQSAEENGKGAKAIIESPQWSSIKPDYIFALHNLPGYALHNIIQVFGQFNPTVQSLKVSLKGVQSHASEPEKGINPSGAIASILNQLNRLSMPDPYHTKYALITPVHINMGEEDYGISPGEATLHFTMRCWTTERMQELEKEILALLNETSVEFRIPHSVEWLEYFPTVYNDDYCNNCIGRAAAKLGLEVIKEDLGCRFGEDFGWYTKECQGAMFGLGAGLHSAPLHNPSYDFPDDILHSGTAMFQRIITEILD